MDKDRQARLKELNAKLDDPKSRNPGHGSGTGSFVAHGMPPSLCHEIEAHEEESKKLES